MVCETLLEAKPIEESTISDTVYTERLVDSLLDAASAIMVEQPIEALKLIEAAEKIAHEANVKSLIADVLHTKSIYHWNRGNYQLALENDRQTLRLFQALNDSSGVAYTLNSLGVTLMELELNHEALKNLLQSELMMVALNDSSGLQMVLLNIGAVFEKMDDYETAMSSYERALELAISLKMPSEMADVYNNMAEIKLAKGMQDEAYELYSQAYQLYKQQGNLDGIATVTLNLGDFYLQTGKLTVAENLLQEARELFSAIQDHHGTCESDLLLGKLYRRSERFEESERILLQVLKQAKTKQYLATYTEAQRQLAQLFYAQENFSKAYERFLAYDFARDSLHKITRTREFDNLRLAYQAEEKDRQLEALRSEREKEQIILLQKDRLRNALIAIAVILFAFSVFGVMMYTRLNNFNRKLEEHQEVLETKNRQIEEQAKQLEEANKRLLNEKKLAEISAQAKAELISELSHEVRTPLNALIGITHILRNEITAEEHRNYLNALYNAAQNLLMFTNNTLDFSKLEAGKLVLQSAPFSPRELVRRVLSPFEMNNTNPDLQLRHEVSDEVPDRLVGDETRFAQILINLVSNAVKYTEKGYVHLRISCVEKNPGCTRLMIRVLDTGMGIPESLQSKVFGRYDRLGNEGEKWTDGSGLGLTITKKLVEWMNGTISFSSIEKEGTIFTVELPFSIATRDTETTTNKNTHLSKLSGCRVLLAEDNEVNIMFTRKLLEQLGMSVTVAKDGVQAEEAIEKQSFDLILMDLQMPRKDGIEATRTILSKNPQSRIIALTANANSSIREELLLEGFCDVIQKPFDPKTLGSYLAGHLPH